MSTCANCDREIKQRGEGTIIVRPDIPLLWVHTDDGTRECKVGTCALSYFQPWNHWEDEPHPEGDSCPNFRPCIATPKEEVHDG